MKKGQGKRKGRKETRFKALEYISKELKTEIRKPKPEAGTLKRLFKELYIFATKDHLTGVFNRRILDELLNKEMVRAIRHNLPLSVILLDIDNFKEYNDKYGHLQGDWALRTMTKIIQQMTRKEDFVARYGGEEFIIGLPDTKLEKARKIAERIRKKIAETKIKATRENIKAGFKKITVSMGISKLSKEGIHYMLNQADVALYKAKAKGKNKVCVIEE